MVKGLLIDYCRQSRTRVDCNVAAWLAMEEQIDWNLPAHNRIDRRMAAQDLSTHYQQCTEAAMATENPECVQYVCAHDSKGAVELICVLNIYIIELLSTFFFINASARFKNMQVDEPNHFLRGMGDTFRMQRSQS